MILTAKRYYKMGKSFSNWKAGEKKNLFVSFAYGKKRGLPQVTGRSELLTLNLLDSYAEFPAIDREYAPNRNWGAISALLFLVSLLVFATLHVLCRSRKGEKVTLDDDLR